MSMLPRVLLSLILLAGLVAGIAPSQASVFETRKFDTGEQQARYRQLTYELRCLVCQNQNIADSNADLAKDLRDKVYEMIMAGRSDTEIIDYMVARYGDFVLYRPPLKASTVALWVGPFLVLLIAVVLLLRYIRRRRQSPGDTAALNDEQRRQAAHLLATNTPED